MLRVYTFSMTFFFLCTCVSQSGMAMAVRLCHQFLYTLYSCSSTEMAAEKSAEYVWQKGVKKYAVVIVYWFETLAPFCAALPPSSPSGSGPPMALCCV